MNPIFLQIFPHNTPHHWQRLEQAYRGEFDDLPHERHYHTMGHVIDMLSILSRVKMEQPDRLYAQGSIFYHDAIYLHKQGGSEQASAKWMRNELGQDYPLELLEQLELGILATDHTADVAKFPYWAKIVHDIDLARLADNSVFVANRDKVRKEYGFVSDKQFCDGQRKFFGKLMEKPLFFTVEFGKYEQSARENLQRWIMERTPA
jgi:predicted metal-dependent HD superfamily phosphohydrolase